MKIFDNILSYGSLSVVGLEKNTGKTETLNWVLKNLKQSGKTVAVTSIGIDGETVDAVTSTSKPEIVVYEGMIFVTTEKFFLNKKAAAEILDIMPIETILGRIVVGKSLIDGKVILSGAADTHSLKKIIDNNRRLGADITIVDGALSRLSLASPAVSEAMILATGAAYSANINTLVNKTTYVCKLINLPKYSGSYHNIESTKGVFCLKNNELIDLGVESSLMIDKMSIEGIELVGECKNLFVSGILSDKTIDFILQKKLMKDIVLVVADFSKIFVSEAKFNALCRANGRICVMQKTNLIALTINPISPQGFVLDGERLKEQLSKNIDVDIIDVVKDFSFQKGSSRP